MKKQQSGFTLIELIMVIVVLGILAAFALPRFADFGGQARVATVEGIAGAMRSAASITHAAQLAAGDGGTDPVTLEGEAITMVGGYPAATAEGIIRAAQVDGAEIQYGTGVVYVAPSGGTATEASSCRVKYTAVDTTATPPVTVAKVEVATSCN